MSIAERLDHIATQQRLEAPGLELRLRDIAGEVAELEREVRTLRELRSGTILAARRPVDVPWDPCDDVREAHRRMHSWAPNHVMLPGRDVRELRRRLVSEEREELDLALLGSSVSEIAHEATDLIYTTCGALVECGLRLRPIWNVVHAANMRKTSDSHSKWTKPRGWQPPDVEGAVELQRR